MGLAADNPCVASHVVMLLQSPYALAVVSQERDFLARDHHPGS